MGERTNGNITIVAGLPETAGPMPDARLPASRKQMLAYRLRKQGWSYRRIAGALDVSYPQVLQWMDEEDDGPTIIYHLDLPRVVPPANNSAPQPPRAAPSPSVSVDVLARLDALAAEQRQQAEALSRLEKRLIDVVKAEAKSVSKRVLDAIKALAKPPSGS